MLVLRPQPAAGETARRIAELGHVAVVAPLFHVRPLPWESPDPAETEAVLLTSANAPRHAGPHIGAFTSLPCYAVGEATAAAARAVGFTDLRIGTSDGAAAVRTMADAGIATALHLCGRDHIRFEHVRVRLIRRCVYASDAVEALPGPAREGLESGAVALVHSPRAAAVFAERIDAAGMARNAISLAAISPAAAEAAGRGWKAKASSDRPRDDALLELAVQLCNKDPMGAGG